MPLEELQKAIDDLLQAREHFSESCGIGVSDEYWDADRRLLAAFAREWPSNEKLLAEAYHHFRKLLFQANGRLTLS